MDNRTLRRVQLVQLEIAKEIKRVCDENGIKFFLDSGTLLGAIRHKGFIPWDDDMDIGMLREEYDKFCEIAPNKLGEKYVLQSWFTDDDYALSFAKIRKKGTVYREGKSANLKNCGFYVDIFPYDKAPEDVRDREKFDKKLIDILRQLLMKCNYTPWKEKYGYNVKKRIGYFYYQLRAKSKSRNQLIDEFEKQIHSINDTHVLFENAGHLHPFYFDETIFSGYREELFEDTMFPVPMKAEQWLENVYGDYMALPPENERYNRHIIEQIDFGENS
jgi:lipopolysaccharide cholinephosphotransferase